MKQPEIRGCLEYGYKNKIMKIPFSAGTPVLEHGIQLKPLMEKSPAGFRFTLRISVTDEVVLHDLYFSTDLVTSRDDRVFLNGYQSWTDTKEFDRKDRMKGPSKLFAPLTEKYKVTRYADYEFQRYSLRRGVFHGSSYGWVRPEGETVRFFGSLDERTGFTFFHADLNKKTMLVRKDCRDLAVTGEYRAFDILFSQGSIDAVMDGYFGEMKITGRPASPASGWTSWYNYYQNISETVILENLASFSEQKLPIDIFQIDDGYQSAVGDWLSINDRFPNGMKVIADKIKDAGFKAGIWLAPFAGETISTLFKEHRAWFIADAKGEPFCTGGNWSAFYSLDIYNEEVRAYIKHVFDVVLNDWGFDLVKLDFLYGACIKPRRNKTRGQIMCDAMDFLRECVADKQILACGVPLWPAFGRVEYCRIGTDIDLQWHNKIYGALIHREFPSTRYALQNSVFRHHLDGRAFINDPDVFLLRHTNIQLTEAQRRTVFYINNLFGNLLFTSDDIREYSKEEKRLYLSSFPLTAKKINSFSFDRELYTADVSIGETKYFFASNHGGKKRMVTLPGSLCFRAGSGMENPWLGAGTELELPPYTAECFLLCTPEIPWTRAGSTMSAFPGSEILSISARKDALSIVLHEKLRLEGLLFITVPEKSTEITVGNIKHRVSRTFVGKIDLYYITVPSHVTKG